MQHDSRPQDGTDGYIYVYVAGDNTSWIWNIPLSDTVTSVGIVCSDVYFKSFNLSQNDFFDKIITENSHAASRYPSASKINEVGFIGGYSAKVKTMFGKKSMKTT